MRLSSVLCFSRVRRRNTSYRNISAYLDRPDVRTTIGVDPSLGDFSPCNEDVGIAFAQSQDSMFPAQLYIAALLERGVRALIYVGANDWGCNWVRILLSVPCVQSRAWLTGYHPPSRVRIE